MPTAVVVGASRGIGLSLCYLLAGRGYQVVGTTRGPAPALAALGVRVEPLELTDGAALAAFADRLGGLSIDLLVCNAGILTRESLAALDADAVRRQFEVNALGPLRVVAALRRHLAAGAKVALITSRMGSIGDNTSGGMYGYRMSKAALNAAGVSLAHDLRPDGVSVVLLHPGFVRTDLTGGRGDREPEDAARAILTRVDELRIETSGRFLHVDGQELPW